jgi:hypothetical protein
MALPTPYISNTNGTSDNAFRISDGTGPFGTTAIVLDNDTTPGTLALRKGSNGTDLMKLQVAGPSGNDDVATKAYVDASPAVNSAEQVVAIPLAFGSGATVNSTFSLPNNTFVTRTLVLVTTAFDGTGGTVSVGYSGQATKFMATGGNNLKVQGVYTRDQYTQQNSGSPQTVLLTYVAPTGATVGAATVLVYFVIAPKV